MDQFNFWHIARCRQGIIRHRDRKELALGIVMKAFQQRAANALNNTTDHLSLDEHWVDGNAAVVGDDVSVNLYPARIDVNVHYRRVYRV